MATPTLIQALYCIELFGEILVDVYAKIETFSYTLIQKPHLRPSSFLSGTERDLYFYLIAEPPITKVIY